MKSHIDRRRDVIASLKALGATGRDVFAIYLTQVLVLAVIGSLIGLVLGASLPFVIVGLFGKLLPLPVVPALHLDELALSLLYGLLTALAFGLWPLARVHDVPVAALFRDAALTESHRPKLRYMLWMALVVGLLIAVVVGLAYDKRVAAVFVVSCFSMVMFHFVPTIWPAHDGGCTAILTHSRRQRGSISLASCRCPRRPGAHITTHGGDVTELGSSGVHSNHNVVVSPQGSSDDNTYTEKAHGLFYQPSLHTHH